MSRRRERTTRSSRNASRRRASSRPSSGTSIVVISLLAVGVALVAIVALTQSAPRGTTAAGPSPATAALVTPSAPLPDSLASGMALGRSDAPVTLEIWSDYQCPYCGELARTYLPRVVGDFVGPGQVRIVAQDIAFLDRGTSTESTDAATAAACAADQSRFWAFHDLLMWNQAGENQGAFARPRLEAMARHLGLDAGAWNACRTAAATSRALADRVARAGALGIVSTPTLVINGRAIVGLPRTYDLLAAALRGAVPTGATAS